MSIDADRARDLLDALEILGRHRGVEPAAYRAVHAAATDAIGRLHADLLDPRAGDFETGVAEHTGLARRLRALPVPTKGQTSGGSAVDPLLGLLARGARTSGTVDAVLGDVTRGMVPRVERVVRDGLREVFGLLERAGAETDPVEGTDRGGRDVGSSGSEDPWGPVDEDPWGPVDDDESESGDEDGQANPV